MTKEEIIKKAYGFRGANREFSQEMGPLVEGILEHAGAEVEDSLDFAPLSFLLCHKDFSPSIPHHS